jgi:hypothetical protein
MLFFPIALLKTFHQRSPRHHSKTKSDSILYYYLEMNPHHPRQTRGHGIENKEHDTNEESGAIAQAQILPQLSPTPIFLDHETLVNLPN